MFLTTTGVRCCISSFAPTLFRVDGVGGWAIKVMKWPLPGAFHCHVSTICTRVECGYLSLFLLIFFSALPFLKNYPVLSAFLFHCVALIQDPLPQRAQAYMHRHSQVCLFCRMCGWVGSVLTQPKKTW